jgi:hypothetical protein
MSSFHRASHVSTVSTGRPQNQILAAPGGVGSARTGISARTARAGQPGVGGCNSDLRIA